MKQSTSYRTFKMENRISISVTVSLFVFTAAAACIDAVKQPTDFYRARLGKERFIDKSLFIEEYLTNQRVGETVRITRPSGWGKSTNLDMLRRYLEIEPNSTNSSSDERSVFGRSNSIDRSAGNETIANDTNNNRISDNRILFDGGQLALTNGDRILLSPLRIANSSRSRKYRQSYPVLLISLADLVADNYRDIESGLNRLVAGLYQRHVYIRDGLDDFDKTRFDIHRLPNDSVNAVELVDSVRFLSALLCRHHRKKVYIFIDDYDRPIVNAFASLIERHQTELRENGLTNEVCSVAFESDQFGRVFNLFWSFFANTLNDNLALVGGILTGRFSLNFTNEYGGLNNVTECTVQHDRYTHSYGFSASEVDRLLTSNRNGPPTVAQFVKTDHGYYRYDSGRAATVYFNPRWISEFISTTTGENRSRIDRDDMSIFDDAGRLSNVSVLTDRLLLSDDVVLEMLDKLLNDQPIRANISQSFQFDSILAWSYSYLVFSGLLSSRSFGFGERELFIPNKRTKNLLERKIPPI